ncbi:MAG: dihydroneopterin aldolase [Thermoleophilia bacterium]|nr:dihydroneopterin aldolase [Thermoleophilia bacterium]
MRIELAGLELHGFHGVLEEERRVGQRFLFDLELDYADPLAPLSDRIEDAVDYRDAVAIVREISDGTAYQLLEALADALALALVERLPLTRARVRVRKPDVVLAVPLEYSAVVAERYRAVRASRV